jgi:hypothetical protein
MSGGLACNTIPSSISSVGAAIAAGLLSLGPIAALATGQMPAVVINEINYAPGGTNNPAEFIELYNNSNAAVDMTGWKFDAGIDYTFPAATTLAAHGYLVISAMPSVFAARWGFTPLGPWTGKLSNSGEQLRLRDAANNIVNSVTYGVGFPWPTAADGDGPSMELINPNLDNSLGGSWRSSSVTQVYVPPNDPSWHFRKGTSEASSPVSAWRNLSFVEDSTWTVGQTSIGYGDDDDHTILADMINNYSSVFLRRTFSVAVGAKPSSLKVRARVDDGCIVWINGQEVARFHVDAAMIPAYNSLAQNHEADPVLFEEITVANAGAFLVEGANVVAVQVFNTTLTSSDLTMDLSLEGTVFSASTPPTPGALNSSFSVNPPPAIRQVANAPVQPTSGQPVTITAKITDPDGVASATLNYQIVNPGAYIRKTDAAYATNWTSVAMYDDGTHGDAVAGDFIFTAVLPGSLQAHRCLVRYKIAAMDTGGSSIEVPYADDGCPNFTYFVYDGVPAWTGAFRPGVTASVTYSTAIQQSLPVYQLIANAGDVTSSQFDANFNEQDFQGTLVYNNQVYDHIRFHNGGEYSTYVTGKNKWRFGFNTAHELQALDNYRRPYSQTWNNLNLNACASPWVQENRGMAGEDEAVSLRLYELIGVPASKSHFLHFRVIDDASETGSTQYQGGDPAGVGGGDLWGLYLAVEQTDGAFLDERALADGNVYHIADQGLGEGKHLGDGQPTDGSDWTTFLAACKNPQTEAWWRANLNMDIYYSFCAGNRIVGNVDLREGFNHNFYHAPDGRWQVIPWDLDMTYIPKTHQNGVIDQNRCLSLPVLAIEAKNRKRELLDLICADAGASGGQFGQLVDEYAGFLAPAGQSITWPMLDAAMWNYNPRSNYQGVFYQTPYTELSMYGGAWTRTLGTADFAGSMKELLGYATNTLPGNLTWALNNGDQRGYGYQYLLAESADTAVPQRPVATYLGASTHPLDDLRFSASAYNGTNAFVAAQWRVGEISAPGIPLYDATRPRVYEVTDVWRSAELASNGVATIPPAALQVGHTYRVRVRHKDATGRWSRWSEAAQLVTAAARSALGSKDLVVSELMYNPPALSAAETAAGYTDKQLFEYIVLLNISGHTLDLEGLAFTKGITYTFGAGVTLAPGERILVVAKAAAFALRYGVAGRVAGEYTGSLDNSGERVTLTSLGQTVQDFTYSDGSHPVGTDPWPTAPDGLGASLVLMNPEMAPDPNSAANWRASIRTNGSPGRADLINYTEWARRHPGLGSLTDDADGDGVSNQSEYFFGSLPLVASSRPEPVSGKPQAVMVDGQTAAYFVFTFARSAESADVDYIVEFSPDLLNWTLPGVYLDGVDNGNGTLTERWRCSQPMNGTQRVFSRLRAQFK